MPGTIAVAIRKVNSARFDSGSYDLSMHIKDIRLLRLTELLVAHGNSKVKLSKTLRKAPAQVSQWFNHTRTISEDSAREIERNAHRPEGWMDTLPDAPIQLKPRAKRVEEERASYGTPWPFESITPATYNGLDAVEKAKVESYALHVIDEWTRSTHRKSANKSAT